MKNLFPLLFIVLLVSIDCYGQVKRKRNIVSPPLGWHKGVTNTTIADSGKIKIYYAFNAIDIKDTKTYDDLQVLEIGDNLSKYYSWFKYNSDSLVADWMKKNPSAQSYPNQLGDKGKDGMWSEYYYSEYFKNFSENIFTEYTRTPRGVRYNTFYIEKTPVIEWQVSNDILSIVGYTCQKATCHFRGRNFIAWFTTDIPINNGPWKFGGLPGLVLKVSDADMLYDFECVKIEISKQKFPIKKYDEYNNYRELDRKKQLKLQKDLNENWSKMTGITLDNPLPKVEYEALELE